ncbi:MAG: VPLPA-CTERM sorting domain-containing protein [Parvularcula sp.]|jgi:hypothetical protein|nr:VPLPA-CTERM sorting domain-containing protein [Parvularcula sp.]
MVRLLAAASVAALSVFGISHAAVQVVDGTPSCSQGTCLVTDENTTFGMSGGDELRVTGSINNDFEPVININPLGELFFSVSASGTGDDAELMRILVTVAGETFSFDAPLSSNAPGGGGVDAGAINFEEFVTASTFSVAFALIDGDGEEIEDVTASFSLNIQAFNENPNVDEVPIPPAGLLLLTAVGGMTVARRRKKTA